MTPITGYAVYDKVTDEIVVTGHGILFQESVLSGVKTAFSNEKGITYNVAYHIKNTLGVDLEKICDEYCDVHDLKSDYCRSRSHTIKFMVESLRKGKNTQAHWSYKDNYLEWIGKYHSVDELMKLAKEAARKSWTDISRYIIIERTLN